MRSERGRRQAGVAALVAALMLAAGPTHRAQAAGGGVFCGTPPRGWTPPGQRGPARDSGPDGGCHAVLCQGRKSRMR